jgi:glutamate-1-semialdehyde 2,1-aminomutase
MRRLVTKKPKKSLEMQARARKRIPGGTQLLSKRPEMFAPGQWPGYYSRAKGIDVWDLDGNRYVDMSINAAGACVLGYADANVDAAVRRAVDTGTNSLFNCPEEVELADLLCMLHPWAEMVRYARAGGEAMAIAVRIARAYSKKDRVAFCGYHGWFDWYLAANLARGNNLDGHLLPGLEPAGVPRVLAGTSFPFRYNHAEELERIVKENKDEVGVIVMEPVRDSPPEKGFLEQVHEVAEESGAVLVFDEVTSAFRMNTGGIHLRLGTNPDMAVFSKALGNGYATGAVIGKEEIMQAAQSSFISSTNWTEKIGPVAALATIRKHRRLNAAEHLIALGNRVQEGWKAAAEEAGLKITVTGIPPLSHFTFEQENGQAMTTLYTQMMMQRGYLASGKFYPMYAHKLSDVEKYIETTKAVFRAIADAVKKKEVEKQLKGPVAHKGFYRLA